MTLQEFENIFHHITKTCNKVLIEKAKEYATDDRLHNFKEISRRTGLEAEKTLVVLMEKHDVSFTDLVNKVMDKERVPWKYFDEKIIDNINYLMLLYAILYERHNK